MFDLSREAMGSGSPTMVSFVYTINTSTQIFNILMEADHSFHAYWVLPTYIAPNINHTKDKHLSELPANISSH